jgi:hypothetical protein
MQQGGCGWRALSFSVTPAARSLTLSHAKLSLTLNCRPRLGACLPVLSLFLGHRPSEALLLSLQEVAVLLLLHVRPCVSTPLEKGRKAAKLCLLLRVVVAPAFLPSPPVAAAGGFFSCFCLEGLARTRVCCKASFAARRRDFLRA